MQAMQLLASEVIKDRVCPRDSSTSSHTGDSRPLRRESTKEKKVYVRGDLNYVIYTEGGLGYSRIDPP